jgi:hypothetical protein
MSGSSVQFYVQAREKVLFNLNGLELLGVVVLPLSYAFHAIDPIFDQKILSRSRFFEVEKFLTPIE